MCLSELQAGLNEDQPLFRHMLYVFAVHNNIEAPLRGSIFAERSGF